MKLLVTTAAAALLSAGIAFAEGDTAAATTHGDADINAAAQSEITTGAPGALNAGAAANQHGGAGAAASAHALADLDTDASGDLSLEEAQAFDPSISATAFATFDTDSDDVLNDEEYSVWAADFDTSAFGQGDADLDAPPADGVEAGVDGAAAVDLGVGEETPDADDPQ